MYYKVSPDIFAYHGIKIEPIIPGNPNFLTGQLLSITWPAGLTFEIDHPAGTPVEHFMQRSIPVGSRLFLDCLRRAGVDNLQTYPVHLHNTSTDEELVDYEAFNVIGVVDAVDLAASTFDEVMPGGDPVPPLLDFERIVFAHARTAGLGMFRIPQNRTLLFVHESVMDVLDQHAPSTGWGISVAEVPER